MTVIAHRRWRISAPEGRPAPLWVGSLDGRTLAPGESVVVVPEQQLQGAVDALRPYLSHDEDCSWRIYGPAGPCECGLTDALERFGRQ